MSVFPAFAVSQYVKLVQSLGLSHEAMAHLESAVMSLNVLMVSGFLLYILYMGEQQNELEANRVICQQNSLHRRLVSQIKGYMKDTSS